MRLRSLSPEALLGLFLGLLAWVVELNWALRSAFVLLTAVLAVHIANRLDWTISIRITFVTVVIGVLVLGTYHPIWIGLNEEFPTITGEAALSTIIEVGTLAACAIALYVFLLRPRGKDGFQVLPAQLIAFGAIVMAAGFVSVAIGLAWQFKQNWAGGVAPTGAPVSVSRATKQAQISPKPPPPALPPPAQPSPELFSAYNLTQGGINALANELYKFKEGLHSRIDLQHVDSDLSSTNLTNSIFRACDLSGIACPINNGHTNSPGETGVMLYVSDPKNPPKPAEQLQTALEHVGIHAPFIARPETASDAFILFVGPAP